MTKKTASKRTTPKSRKQALRFIGGCSAQYWDENGKHRVKPGEIKKFTPAMAKERLKEAVWQKEKDGE